MQKASKQGFRKRLAQQVIRRMLRRQFAGVHVTGDVETVTSTNMPTLYFANHVSLWDFSVANYLTYMIFGQDSFVMAAEYTMLPVAPWAGAFSINPSDSFSIARTIRYAAELLSSVPRCGLWMFPQGTVSPRDQHPLGFKPGTGLLVRKVRNLLLVPVAIDYAFINHVQPEVFVGLGESFTLSSDLGQAVVTSELEHRATRCLEQLKDDLANARTEHFRTVLEGNHDIRYYSFQLMRKSYPPLKKWGTWY